MCEGEAIWNACLGTTALAVNVDLPSNEVLFAHCFSQDVSAKVWDHNLQIKMLKMGNNGQNNHLYSLDINVSWFCY